MISFFNEKVENVKIIIIFLVLVLVENDYIKIELFFKRLGNVFSYFIYLLLIIVNVGNKL